MRLVEQPLAGKLVFQLLKRNGERTRPIGLHVLCIKLVLARGFIYGNAPSHNDIHAVFRQEPQA